MVVPDPHTGLFQNCQQRRCPVDQWLVGARRYAEDACEKLEYSAEDGGGVLDLLEVGRAVGKLGDEGETHGADEAEDVVGLLAGPWCAFVSQRICLIL